jgi:hypothetical protein
LNLWLVLFRGADPQPDIGPFLSLLVFSLRSDNPSAFAYIHNLYSHSPNLFLETSLSLTSSLSERFPQYHFCAALGSAFTPTALLLHSLFVSVQTRATHCFHWILEQPDCAVTALSSSVACRVWKDLFDLTVSLGSPDVILSTLLFKLFLQPNDWFFSSLPSHSQCPQSLGTRSMGLLVEAAMYRSQHLFRDSPPSSSGSPTLISPDLSLGLLSLSLHSSQLFVFQTLCASQGRPRSCCLLLQLSLYHLREHIDASPFPPLPLPIEDSRHLSNHLRTLFHDACSLGHPLISIMSLTCLHLLRLPLPCLNLCSMTPQTFHPILHFLLTTKRNSSHPSVVKEEIEDGQGQKGDLWASLAPSVLPDSVDKKEFEEILYSNPELGEREMIDAVLLSETTTSPEPEPPRAEESPATVSSALDLFGSFQHIKTSFPPTTSDRDTTASTSAGKRLVTIRTRDGKSKTFTVNK